MSVELGDPNMPGHHTRYNKLTVIRVVEPGDPNRPPLQDGKNMQQPCYWIWVQIISGTNAATLSKFVSTSALLSIHLETLNWCSFGMLKRPAALYVY
jgi:hypothetical protein